MFKVIVNLRFPLHTDEPQTDTISPDRSLERDLTRIRVRRRRANSGLKPRLRHTRLILLGFCVIALHRYCAFCLFVCFYKLKVCGNDVMNKCTGPFFQQHLLTVCLCVTFGQFLQYFKLFQYYYVCYGDV